MRNLKAASSGETVCCFVRNQWAEINQIGNSGEPGNMSHHADKAAAAVAAVAASAGTRGRQMCMMGHENC